MDDERAPQHGRWLQRAVGLTTAVVLTMLAGIYYAQAQTATERGSTASDDPSMTGRDVDTTVPEPSARSSPPDGPGVNRPGVLLRFAAAPGDRLDVSESVLLGRPTDRVVLRAPRVRRAGAPFGDSRARVVELQVTVDGQPIVVPSRLGRTPVTVDLGGPTARYELRYLLLGTTVRSVPSTTGRALVATGSLTRASSRRDVMVTSDDPSVLNLTCPLLAGDDTACADVTAGTWRLRSPLSGSEALVVAQIDLPAP